MVGEGVELLVCFGHEGRPPPCWRRWSWRAEFDDLGAQRDDACGAGNISRPSPAMAVLCILAAWYPAGPTRPRHTVIVSDTRPTDLMIGDLSQTERSLVTVATTGGGRILDVRKFDPDDAQIRAGVLVWLVTSQEIEPIAVRIRGASIIGQVNLGGRRITCPLELADCILDAPLVLTKASAPNISLRGSHVPGLHANFLHVDGTLNLGGGFNCVGPTKLFGADLGEIEAEGGVFKNARGYSINADYLHVHSFATFERAQLWGTLRMLAAHVDGQLDCTGAKIFAPPGENAVELDSATLTGGGRFASAKIQGGLWMVNMTADAEVDFQRAEIHNSGGYAIDASSVRVDSFNFAQAVVEGEVKLVSAELGTLDCYDAQFLKPLDASLDLDSTTITGAFHAYFSRIEGLLDLTNTSIGVLRDTSSSWPGSARLIGASYGKLEGDEDALDSDKAPLSERLRWLKLDDRYHPQKYSALATAYQNVGQEALARQVSIAGEHDRRVSNKGKLHRRLAWTWSSLLRLLVGYGYAPARALWWLAGLIVVGAVLTAWGHAVGEIRPIPNQSPDFNPVRYTVALLFPVAGLPDSKSFATSGAASWLAFGLSLAGWFLAAVVVSALTGLLKRR